MKLNQPYSTGKQSTYAQHIAILPFLLSAALCISKRPPLQSGSVLCPLRWGTEDGKRRRANESQAALHVDVFWVPKYFWCFKFEKQTALRLRLSENWKQRQSIMHINIVNPIELSNKIKNPDMYWKKYFQLIWPLGQKGTASSHCSFFLQLHPCVHFSWSVKPPRPGQTPAAASTGTLQRRNSVKWVHLGHTSGLSASSCVAGLRPSEVIRQRQEPSFGLPVMASSQRSPAWVSAELIPYVGGFTAYLLHFSFFLVTKPSSWGFCRGTRLDRIGSKRL